ncbi:MAG: hypothetical protein ACKPKO_05970, partial [Candidatus Fonsibacter sp.]
LGMGALLPKKPQQKQHEVLWITLGFHPAWYMDIKRAVGAYMRSDWSRLLNEAFNDQGLDQDSRTVRIAWKNVCHFTKKSCRTSSEWIDSRLIGV